MSFEVIDIMIALLVFVLALGLTLCLREIYVRRNRENQRIASESVRRLFDDGEVTLLHHQQ